MGDEETLVIPAGHYEKTERNLRVKSNIQLLIASGKVQGSYGPGQGCIIHGKGRIETEGKTASKVKQKYDWARGALIVKVDKYKTLL